MAKVVLRPNEIFEVALRRFKRAVEKSGVLSKSRRCKAYEKPSAIRKRKKAAAKKRLAKKQMRENQMLQNRMHRQY